MTKRPEREKMESFFYKREAPRCFVYRATINLKSIQFSSLLPHVVHFSFSLSLFFFLILPSFSPPLPPPFFRLFFFLVRTIFYCAADVWSLGEFSFVWKRRIIRSIKYSSSTEFPMTLALWRTSSSFLGDHTIKFFWNQIRFNNLAIWQFWRIWRNNTLEPPSSSPCLRTTPPRPIDPEPIKENLFASFS